MEILTAIFGAITAYLFKDIIVLYKEILRIQKEKESFWGRIAKIMEVYYGFSEHVLHRKFLLPKYFVVINAGLINTAIKIAEKQLDRGDSGNYAFSLTIAGMLIGKKAKQNTVAISMCLAGIAIQLLGAYFLNTDDNLGVISILLAFIIVVIANQKLTEYRISRGFYGKNYYEAKEMIQFLLSHSDKSDFTDGDGLKHIFPKPKKKSIDTSHVEPGMGEVVS